MYVYVCMYVCIMYVCVYYPQSQRRGYLVVDTRTEACSLSLSVDVEESESCYRCKHLTRTGLRVLHKNNQVCTCVYHG
jgi:queuine/archaeosine tRNA-ribosyltransferase